MTEVSGSKLTFRHPLLQGIEIKIPISTITLDPITIMVGYVPLVIVPEITIICVISAEGGVALTVKKLASMDYSIVFGVRFINAAKQTTRTVLPSTVFDKYVYIFTKSGGAAVEKTSDKNGVFTLELGSYTVEVKAYIGAAEPYTLVASGVSSQFTVSSGSNAAVEVFLSEVNSGGQGKFSYTITYPAGATAEITLQKWPGLNNIALNPGNIANGKTQTLQLDTGSYLLAVLVIKDGSSAGISEAVHITSSLSTVYTKNFNDNDLIAPITVSAVTVKPSTSLVVGGTEMLYAEIEPSYATDKRVGASPKNEVSFPQKEKDYLVKK